jgi:methionyl-tRNA synthetase
MGKDNVPFHTLFFPGYLLGTHEDWTKLNSISTTEYLQYEGTKFSKSRGVGVFGENARDTGIPASVWRYFLISNRPETGDTQFTWKAFIAGNNAELLNNLGNFVNRVVKFVNAKYDGVLPQGGSAEAEGESEKELKKDVDKRLGEYVNSMADMRLRSGLEIVMHISAKGNQYLQSSDLSNALFNDKPEKCADVVLLAVNLIYLISVLIHPFMPSTEESILRQLNAPARSLPETFTSNDILPGHKLGKAEYLFTKIDAKMEDVWRKQFGDKSSVPAEESAADKKGKKKGRGAAAAKTEERPAYTGPRTQELDDKEKEVTEQGAKVRDIKAKKVEGDAAVEVAKLLALKKELGDLVERLESVQVTTALE